MDGRIEEWTYSKCCGSVESIVLSYLIKANLETEQLDRLKSRVTEFIDPEEDSLRLYPLCAACCQRIEILGQGTVTQDPDVIAI